MSESIFQRIRNHLTIIQIKLDMWHKEHMCDGGTEFLEELEAELAKIAVLVRERRSKPR